MEYPNESEALGDIESELAAFAEKTKRSIEAEKEKLVVEKAEMRAAEAKRTAMNAITNSAEQAKMAMLAEAEAEAKRKTALDAEMEARDLTRKAVDAASEASKTRAVNSEVKEDPFEAGSEAVSEPSRMNEEAF